MDMPKFIFVIDTEEYSGNFERCMTAYITGRVGECGVGEEYAAMYRKEIGITEENEDEFDNELVAMYPTGDSSPCMRPTTIWPTKGWHNDGNGKFLRNKTPKDEKKFPAYMSVGIFMNRKPTDEEISQMKLRAHAFCELRAKNKDSWKRGPAKVTGFRLIENAVTTTETVL